MLKKILYITFIFNAIFFCKSVLAAFSHAEEFSLSNGMQVIVIPNRKAPIVQQVVLYKAGSIDEPKGKGGIAHLLEHLMFRGTYKFKDGKFDELSDVLLGNVEGLIKYANNLLKEVIENG